MKNIRPSVLFWNALISISVIVSGFINFDLFGIEMIFITMLSIPALLEFASELDSEFIHFWTWLSPIMWILTIFAGIIWCGIWVKENVFDNINNWLDNKFKK